MPSFIGNKFVFAARPALLGGLYGDHTLRYAEPNVFRCAPNGRQRVQLHALHIGDGAASPHARVRQVLFTSFRRLPDTKTTAVGRIVDGAVGGHAAAPGRPSARGAHAGELQQAADRPVKAEVAPSLSKHRTAKQRQKQSTSVEAGPLAEESRDAVGPGAELSRSRQQARRSTSREAKRSSKPRAAAADAVVPAAEAEAAEVAVSGKHERMAKAVAATAAAAEGPSPAADRTQQPATQKLTRRVKRRYSEAEAAPSLGSGGAAAAEAPGQQSAALGGTGAAGAASSEMRAAAQPLQTAPTAAPAARAVSQPSPTAATSPATSPAAAAGLAAPQSRSPPPAVYVFWDLDNKYPETLDHRGMLGRMRDMLREYGNVVEIRAYANFQTLNYVPDIWEEAMLLGMERPREPAEEVPRCPVCGAKFPDESRLERHFRQLHVREHSKRLAHRPAAKKYVQSEGFARYQSAARGVLAKKRGYDLGGILGRLGVAVRAVPMGPQRADVVLQQEAVELLQEEGDRVAAAVESGRRPPVLCLVSDDHGFEPLLKLYRTAGWGTLVVSHTGFKNAQARLPWLRVADSP